MYRRHFKAVIGFHGCDSAIAQKIICDRQAFRHSNNDYDWLGPGVYFWENSPERARAFADEQAVRTKSKKVAGKAALNHVASPSVVGAVLDIGLCLDLTDQVCLDEMQAGYERLKHNMQLAELELPINEGVTNVGDKSSAISGIVNWTVR